MIKSIFHTNTSAVSELIGGLLIVIIAIVASATIYTQMLPVPVPSPEPNIKLMGYITEGGTVIIEHMGGETIYSYEIHVCDINGTKVYKYNNSPWEIGDRKTPPNTSLLSENDEIRITVYCIYEDPIYKLHYRLLYFLDRFILFLFNNLNIINSLIDYSVKLFNIYHKAAIN